MKSEFFILYNYDFFCEPSPACTVLNRVDKPEISFCPVNITFWYLWFSFWLFPDPSEDEFML